MNIKIYNDICILYFIILKYLKIYLKKYLNFRNIIILVYYYIILLYYYIILLFYCKINI